MSDTRSHNYYHQRRQRLIKALDGSSIAIVFAAADQYALANIVTPYLQDSSFYYLTGLNEPDLIAVFIPEHAEGEYIIFAREKDAKEKLWTGTGISLENLKNEFGADQILPMSKIEELLPGLISGRTKIYCNGFDNMAHYKRIVHWMKPLSNLGRRGINMPRHLIDIGEIVDNMRFCKDEHEIDLISQSAAITAEAQVKLMKSCRPGMMEYELEAEVWHTFVRHQGSSMSFRAIIAGGANGCVLHYDKNNHMLRDGDMVVADIGCLFKHYAGDITRTFPVNGKFTSRQRAVYEAVLDAQRKTIEAIKPHVSWDKLQQISEMAITENFLDLGLLQSKGASAADLWEQKAFKPFYMHFVSHWLGLEAHDAGEYKLNASEILECEDNQTKSTAWRSLTPNVVMTVEPGIYIPANMPNVAPEWWNIAVRIEDDILVTQDGCKILSAAAPKEVSAIEDLMSSKG
jgi:Xaa-Pro aminopeptidase